MSQKIRLNNYPKCEMARLNYCKKSQSGHCIADEKEINNCPYLSAIREIARLAIENS